MRNSRRKAAIVKELREKGYRLKDLLKAIGIAKSTYYFETSKGEVVANRNNEMMKLIKEIFNQNKGRYGVRRVHRELLNRGYLIKHKRVQRLMHNMGLFGKRPKERYHSYKGNVADNIINRILMLVDHYKNGLLMYLNSIFLGVNVIFLQY